MNQETNFPPLALGGGNYTKEYRDAATGEASIKVVVVAHEPAQVPKNNGDAAWGMDAAPEQRGPA